MKIRPIQVKTNNTLYEGFISSIAIITKLIAKRLITFF